MTPRAAALADAAPRLREDRLPRRRVLVIANPMAGGRGRGRRRLARVAVELERRGCSVAIRHIMSGPEAAERAAREAAAEFDIVAAAGGDGTLHAVANGVAATGRPLAVLPFGTANVLARELRLPRRAAALAELIVSGPTRLIWPGQIGDRLFLTMASSGIDAEIVAAIDPRLKRRFGRLAFVWAAVGCLRRYRAGVLTVRVGGIDYDACGIIAAKGRFYGGPFVIAPRADLGEPILDLVMLRRAGRRAALRYAGALLLGRTACSSDLLTVRARAAWVSADSAAPVQADGELVGYLPAMLGIAERPLHLVAP